MRKGRPLAVIALAALLSCATSGLRERVVTPEGRAPLAFVRIVGGGDTGRALPGTPLAGEARARARFGGGTLWATTAGLFVEDAGTWTNLERAGAPVTDAIELAPGAPLAGARRAWVREGEVVWRLSEEKGRVAWTRLLFPSQAGRVLGLGAIDGERFALATTSGVVIASEDGLLLAHLAGRDRPPDAIGGGGGWAWVAWGDAVVRTDGARWEELARGLSFAPGARVVVDECGAAATILDGRGGTWRISADETLRLGGLVDGARVTDTLLPLEALAEEGTLYDEVDYSLDGHPLATRHSPPWGWGRDGRVERDVGEMSFGPHVVRVDARTQRGRSLSRTLHLVYASPFGRVPSYAADIAPLFRDHCASCHDRGHARDLASYERLRSMIARVRASVRERRMPPDLALDPAGVALLTSWCDGDGPP